MISPVTVCCSAQSPLENVKKELDEVKSMLKKMEKELDEVKMKLLPLEKLEEANNLNETQQVTLERLREEKKQLWEKEKQLREKENLLLEKEKDLRHQTAAPPAGDPPLLSLSRPPARFAVTVTVTVAATLPLPLPLPLVILPPLLPTSLPRCCLCR
jgi:hypothetical protein